MDAAHHNMYCPLLLPLQVRFFNDEDLALGGVDFGVVPLGATMVKQVLIGNDSRVDMSVTLLSSNSRFQFWQTGPSTLSAFPPPFPSSLHARSAPGWCMPVGDLTSIDVSHDAQRVRQTMSCVTWWTRTPYESFDLPRRRTSVGTGKTWLPQCSRCVDAAKSAVLTINLEERVVRRAMSVCLALQLKLPARTGKLVSACFEGLDDAVCAAKVQLSPSGAVHTGATVTFLARATGGTVNLTHFPHAVCDFGPIATNHEYQRRVLLVNTGTIPSQVALHWEFPQTGKRLIEQLDGPNANGDARQSEVRLHVRGACAFAWPRFTFSRPQPPFSHSHSHSLTQ